MSRARAMEAVTGVGTSAAFAVSWVSPLAVQDVLGRWDSPEDGLAELAVTLGVDLAFVPAAEEWAPACARALRARDIAVAWAVPGPLGRVAERAGWTTVLSCSAADPEALAAPLADALRETVQAVGRGADAGADLVVLADDIAADSGWLVSPDFVRSALVPGVELVAATAGYHRMPTVYHSDGDIRVLFGAMRTAGVAGIQLGTLGTGSLTTVVAAARAEGLVTLGSVSASRTSSVDIAGTANELANLLQGGGFIACDDGGTTTADELRTLQELYRETRRILEV